MTRPAPLESAEVAGRRLASYIAGAMPEGWGFALMCFSINQGPAGNMTYVSNLSRPDMIKALRELVDKLESGAPER